VGSNVQWGESTFGRHVRVVIALQKKRIINVVTSAGECNREGSLDKLILVGILPGEEELRLCNRLS
jgi:hypothetical protein